MTDNVIHAFGSKPEPGEVHPGPIEMFKHFMEMAERGEVLVGHVTCISKDGSLMTHIAGTSGHATTLLGAMHIASQSLAARITTGYVK
jgi:hypothetical protein